MKEPYYLTFLQQINTKYSEKQMQIIKDKLSNNDVISINPFVSIPYHTLREQSLAKSIILMAKQIDQLPYRQLNQTFLKEFISHYSSDLKDLLSQSTFHSTMFCLTIIRYIQQTHKNYPNYSVVAAQLEELLALLQNLLGKTLSERKIFLSRQSSIKRQQSENQIHNIFLVLMMIASIRCMGADEFLINEQGFIQNSLKLAIEFIKLAQNQREFKVLMEYLSVVSYLIIFNEEVYQPTNFVSFTLDQKTALHQNVNYLKKQINENYITQYFSGLQGLIREEKRYKSELISKLKKLIQLNIMNEMIVKHIGILIDLIKEKTFPSLKTQFVVMLVEAQNSKNTYIVDQITQLLLNIGADFFDEEVQKFTLILLRNNPTKRIQIFVRLYNTFLKDLGVKVSVQTINFILSNKLKYSSAFENIRPIIRDHASIIDNKNMETLHQLIRSTSQKIYIQMLEDIVQNRSQCFQSGDQCPFVLQIWLKKVGPILQVYHIFFDALIKNLCGINKLSTQTEWEILTIAQSQLPTCSLYYEMLLTNLQKEEIYSQHLYVKVAFCQAILGYKLKIETYSYYSKYIAIQNYPSFIIFLRNLVTKVRTSSAVILYVHALLYSQINYDLNFILHQIQHSQFFRIVTYSIQAVALLYEFILKAAYNNQNYQTPLMIIQHWSGQMKKAQCKLITYFYIYRQIRKIYPFLKESKMRQPTDRLKILWDIIVNILNEEQPNSAYIRMGQLNKLIVQSSNTKPMHRSIQIQAGLLSNIFLEESWNIEISTTLQQYNIFVSKSKITVIQRSKEIKSNIASNISAQWVFHMENGNCQDTIFLLQLRQGNRIHFMVNKTEIQQIQMQGYVQAVKFCTQSNLLLKKIKIKDNKELENLSTITDHLNHLNEWTIKLKKLNLTKVSSFVEKFDFDHAFCLFASMLKNDYISLSQSYNMCFRIAIKMVKLLYRQGKMEKPASIICIFNKLQKYFYRLENDAKNLQTILDLQCPEKYGSLLYYLISSAILPKIFWDSFSNSTKLSLKRFLKKMFQENNFISYQNSQLNLFERCLQLSLTHRQFLDICGSIVMKHSLNNILTFKFKRYLCLVSFNPEFKSFCSQLLKRIISHLNNGNTKYIQEQMHSRFIIMNFQEIYNIFALCNIQGKITILQTLSFELVNSNNNNKQKIKEVIRQLTEIVQENEKNYLIPWLITQLNQEINISPKINFQKLKVVSHYLQLIFLNYSFCLKTEKINMMKIVLQSLKVIKQSVKNYAFEVQLRAIFNANAYAKGIQEFKKDSSQQPFKQIKSQIEQSILSLILSHFSKQLFLKFFIHLRRNINNNLNLLFYLIDHQSFAQLQPFKLSIYLQFLVQMMTIIQYRSPFKQQENQLISKQIIRSLSKILSNAESFHSKGLRKYLFYSYPRLECKPYYLSQLSQQRAQLLYRLKLAQSIQYQQLKGGIYFKCVLIILKAMDIQPKSDYTHLVKYFLLHPQGFNKRKIKGQVFRSFIEGYKSSVIQLHKQYYHESDTEMKHQQDSSIDLDNYIVDYFLMGLSKFMSKNSKEISSNLLFKYNQLFLQGCLQPQIWKDIISSEIRYLAFDNYEILLKLLNGQYIYQPEYQSKKILNMFQLVKQDHRNWIVQPQCHNIHLHFSSKAKEIMIIEHIHTHYVLSQIGKKTYIQGMNNNDVWREEDFNKLYEILLQQERRVPTSNQLTYFEEKLRKIKKIQPYTCRRKPVYKVMQNCLNNLACPATFKFVAKNYEATPTKSQKSINFDHYLQSKIQVHSPFENGSITELIVQDYSQESDTVGQYCQLITKQGSYFCQYQLQDKILKLFSRIDKPQASEYWFLLLGSNNFIHIENRQFSIDLGKSDEIFIRKYNNITANSIQIFYPNGTSRFLNFFVKKNLSSFMLKIQKVTKGLKIIKDASLYFQELRYTEKWLKGYLSNFDYLMLINKFSGRTYNDLNQYYIFPWVLQNYDTDILDLNHTNNYRDLSKPIGALNEKQLQKCKKKYYEELELNVQACFYRSHYSTEAFVFYYLFRIQPYSSLYRDLQGQKWDDPDRLFASIRQVWESVTDQKGDIKQLIPQFYYFPLFLRNISNVDFGIRQNNQKVNHVILPKWCSSPQQFILTMRAALQSDYVSQNLHHWIDLIFGVHQKSAEKNNVFRANCYADPRVYSSIRKQTPQAIKGIVAQINYFGQCPIQLFKKQHKPKHTLHFKDKRSVKSQISSTIRPSREYISFQGKIKSLDNDQQYFYLQIEIRNQTKWFSLPISEPVQKIKQIIQKPRFKNKDLSTIKVKVRDENQLTIGDEILFDISIKFQYSHIQTSQMWIACYGTKGIKVLNWQQEQYWSWLQDQVCQVYVQTTRLIFLTPTGKLYFYSFFDKTIQQYRVFKDVCNMTMRVHRLPRLPSKQKNFIQYRVLCVGDAKKVMTIQHKYSEVYNSTSRANLTR